MSKSIFFILSIVIFSIGFFGVLVNRKNIIKIVMAIEMMLLSSTMNFILSSSIFNDITGWVMSLIILGVAACELAIGLSLLVIYFRITKNLDIEFINNLKG